MKNDIFNRFSSELSAVLFHSDARHFGFLRIRYIFTVCDFRNIFFFILFVHWSGWILMACKQKSFMQRNFMQLSTWLVFLAHSRLDNHHFLSSKQFNRFFLCVAELYDLVTKHNRSRFQSSQCYTNCLCMFFLHYCSA